jgi:hypothetical protein
LAASSKTFSTPAKEEANGFPFVCRGQLHADAALS